MTDNFLMLQKQLVAHFGPPADSAWCVECAGNGMILHTRQVVDHVSGGYEDEVEETCEDCDGTGRV